MILSPTTYIPRRYFQRSRDAAIFLGLLIRSTPSMGGMQFIWAEFTTYGRLRLRGLPFRAFRNLIDLSGLCGADTPVRCL